MAMLTEPKLACQICRATIPTATLRALSKEADAVSQWQIMHAVAHGWATLRPRALKAIHAELAVLAVPIGESINALFDQQPQTRIRTNPADPFVDNLPFVLCDGCAGPIVEVATIEDEVLDCPYLGLSEDETKLLAPYVMRLRADTVSLTRQNPPADPPNIGVASTGDPVFEMRSEKHDAVEWDVALARLLKACETADYTFSRDDKGHAPLTRLLDRDDYAFYRGEVGETRVQPDSNSFKSHPFPKERAFEELTRTELAARILIGCGADIDAPINNDGDTLLISLARSYPMSHSCAAAVVVVLKLGADLDKPNRAGECACDVAREPEAEAIKFWQAQG